MRSSLLWSIFFLWLVAQAHCNFVVVPKEPASGQLHNRQQTETFATQWAELYLRLIRESAGFLSPPGVARALFMITSAMYDAWSCYDAKALPTAGASIRVMGTEEDMKQSVSYAAYRVIQNLFQSKPDQLATLDQFFADMGYAKNDVNEFPTNPVGVGNICAKKMLNVRLSDGFNQLGDQIGSPGGLYSDYTNYFPTNNPQTEAGVTDCGNLRSINKWVPLLVPRKNNTAVTQTYAAPYAGNALPFSLSNPSQFRPPGPPVYTAASSSRLDFIAQYTEVLNVTGNLDDRLKTIAEFWADGPASTLPPGHWHAIALQSAQYAGLATSETIKLLFLQAAAVFDAGIAVWDAKRFFDSGRPVTVIQCLFSNQTVSSWKGIYQGIGEINGSLWQPYQNPFFVTPPFSEYVSGHSAFSGASAEVLKSFFGSDEFLGDGFVLPAGASLFEPQINEGSPGHIAGVTDVPNSGPETVGYSPAEPITLNWSTFTEAALEAGASRIYGGIHIKAGNEDGMALGRKVGEAVWLKGVWLFEGGDQEPTVCETCPECERVEENTGLNSASRAAVITVSVVSGFIILAAVFVVVFKTRRSTIEMP